MDREQGTGSPGNRASFKRSIHSSHVPSSGHKPEIQFLRYRLDVVQSWPDSERKRVLMEAIQRRLAASASPAE